MSDSSSSNEEDGRAAHGEPMEVHEGESSAEITQSQLATLGFSSGDFVRRSDRRRKSITRFEPQKSTHKERRNRAYDQDDSDESSSEESEEYGSRRSRKRRITEAQRRNEEEDFRNRRAGSSLRAVQRKSYAESDSDDFMDEEDRAVARALAKQKAEEEDGDVIEIVMDHKLIDNDRHYLIKWKGTSHLHNTWVVESEVRQLKGYKRLQNYIKKQDQYERWMRTLHPEDREQENVEREAKKALQEAYTRVDRIVAEREDESGLIEYFVLWENLPYADATWEAQKDIGGYQKKIDQYIEREDSIGKTRQTTWPQNKTRPFTEMKRQPSWLAPLGLELRDYQLSGVNWLMYSWSKHTNVILADEMGLGKTIQCVVFLGVLAQKRNLCGPFLVVVPLSTLPAWRHEFAKWAPFLNVVTYVGDKESRGIIRDFEFYQQEGRQRRFRLNVLVTTYELVQKDKTYLGNISWRYLLVDEAHRLKDKNSKLYEVLDDFKTSNRLLITGTPLQNTLKELWCLLHFLDPRKFNDFDEFEEKYDSIDQGKHIGSLHGVLKPYLLRRVKREVLKSLPQKTERILRVQQTPMQRRFYKIIIAKNYEALNKGDRKQSLMNTVMELKKVCNHPFLLPAANAEADEMIKQQMADKMSFKAAQLRAIITHSGKMVLLHKLLDRLKKDGNRVLIFSQMVRMLDILAQYLQACGHRFQRLDGSMPSRERQQAMNHFNKKDSEDFAFLLSTRAGGLGVNLATADTVVIFDSDWNPQNDLQAMARAHRIGQKRHVNIYRFVTKETVEEKILERAKKKMILDHLVIQQMDTSGRLRVSNNKRKTNAFSCKDLTKILKFGARKLFAKDRAKDKEDKKNEDGKGGGGGGGGAEASLSSSTDNKENENVEEDMDLDEILRRAETKNNDAEEETQADSLLSQFNVAEFKTNEMAAEVKVKLEESDDEEGAWDDIVPDHLIPEDQKGLANEITLLAPRQRRQVKRYGDTLHHNENDNDSDYDDDSDGDDSDDAVIRKKRKKDSTLSKKQTTQLYKGLARFGNADHALKWLREIVWKDRVLDENFIKLVLSEAEKMLSLAEEEVKKVKEQRKLQQQQLKKNSSSSSSSSSSSKKKVANPTGSNNHNGSNEQVGGGGEGGANSATSSSTSTKKKTLRAAFKYRGQYVDADALIQRKKERETLDKELKKLEGQSLMNYRVRAIGLRQVTWPCRPPWGTLQDSMLLLGVYVHGMNAWDDIIEDSRLGLKKHLYKLVKQQQLKQQQQSVKKETAAAAVANDSSSTGDKNNNTNSGSKSSSNSSKNNMSRTPSASSPKSASSNPPSLGHKSTSSSSSAIEANKSTITKGQQQQQKEKKYVRIVKNSQLKNRVLRLLEHLDRSNGKKTIKKKVRPGTKTIDRKRRSSSATVKKRKKDHDQSNNGHQQASSSSTSSKRMKKQSSASKKRKGGGAGGVKDKKADRREGEKKKKTRDTSGGGGRGVVVGGDLQKKAIKMLKKDENERILFLLSKLKKKYGGKCYLSEDDDKGKKARRYILEVGDFIIEQRKNKSKSRLVPSLWNIASRSLGESGDFFQEAYVAIIERNKRI